MFVGIEGAVKPSYVGHFGCIQRPPILANLWKTLDIMTVATRTFICVNVQFIMQRQLVELEGGYITVSMNRNFKHSNLLPLENCCVCPYLWQKFGG